jgi:hypothetical protein
MKLLHSYSSENAQFSTMNGSGDGIKPTCWTTGPNYNKWYSFKSESSYLKMELKTDSIFGDIEKPMLALFDNTFNEIACTRFVGSQYDLELEYSSLIKDSVYYISVDNSSQFRYVGSYTLNLFSEPNFSEAGGALPIVDYGFEIQVTNGLICFVADSINVDIEFTTNGLDIEFLDLEINDCYNNLELIDGYYRVRMANKYSDWVYFEKTPPLNKEDYVLIDILGRPIHSPQDNSVLTIKLYNEGGLLKSSKRITF